MSTQNQARYLYRQTHTESVAQSISGKEDLPLRSKEFSSIITAAVVVGDDVVRVVLAVAATRGRWWGGSNRKGEVSQRHTMRERDNSYGPNNRGEEGNSEAVRPRKPAFIEKTIVCHRAQRDPNTHKTLAEDNDLRAMLREGLGIGEDGRSITTAPRPARTSISHDKREQRRLAYIRKEWDAITAIAARKGQPEDDETHCEEAKHNGKDNFWSAVVKEVSGRKGNEGKHEADGRDRCHLRLREMRSLFHRLSDNREAKRGCSDRTHQQSHYELYCRCTPHITQF